MARPALLFSWSILADHFGATATLARGRSRRGNWARAKTRKPRRAGNSRRNSASKRQARFGRWVKSVRVVKSGSRPMHWRATWMSAASAATKLRLNGRHEAAGPFLFPKSIARRGLLFPSPDRKFTLGSGPSSIVSKRSETADRDRPMTQRGSSPDVSLAEPGPRLSRHGPVAPAPKDDPVGHDPVQLRQRVKGNGGIGMVLDVIGHVPGKPPDHLACVSGAGVVESVARPFAASVFRIEIRPQDQLADEQGNDPYPEQDRRVERQRNDKQHRIARHIKAGFPHDVVALVLGYPGNGDLAGQGMTKHQPHAAGDLQKTAIGDRELRVRSWFRANDQFRIVVGILRVAMMVPMKQAIIFVRKRDYERRQIAHGKVERAA